VKIKKTFCFEVTPQTLFSLTKELQPLRLDKWLAQFQELGSRTTALHLIENSFVKVNNETVVKSSFKVKEGMTVEVSLPEKAPLTLLPNQNPLDIVYEDESLIVINKPAGLVVHPSLGHLDDSLVHRLLGYCQLSSNPLENLSKNSSENLLPSSPSPASEETTPDSDLNPTDFRPGVVHRLDKDTSGLIVLAKTDHAHRFLAEQFKVKTAFRVYEAICYGQLRPHKGSIQSYLQRHPSHRKKRSSVRDLNQSIIRDFRPHFHKGKWAVTHFEVKNLDVTQSVSLVELKLETGRTHQIRVHLSELGYPIVGDSLYGDDQKRMRKLTSSLKTDLQKALGNKDYQDSDDSKESSSRVLLHAKELGFIHPTTLKLEVFRRDWPEPVLHLREQLFCE
jgi:23S rRNA pseudouridine1911/1915/1917 synthase